MLSNTRKYRRGDTVLTYRKDALTALSITCPSLRKHGKCKNFDAENTLRHQIAKEKDEELRKRALAMYNTQLELLEGIDDDNQERMTVGFSINPKHRGEVLAKLIEELKQEPAFIHWNLEAAVEECMIERGLRRCRYSHQPVVKDALKRARAVAEDTASKTASKTAPSYETAWAKERIRAFASLTPMQRCVACLLWQQRFQIPRHVVCDVRLALEQEAEAKYREDIDAREAYLTSQDFESAVAAAGRVSIVCVVCRPELGVLDFTALPKIVSYLSCNPKAGGILPSTVQYFCGDSSGPAHVRGAVLPGKLTEKEINFSHPAQAMQLVEVIEWMLHVYRMESRLGSDSAGGRGGIPDGGVVVRSLCFQNCEMSSAEALVDALQKHHFQKTLLALDLSRNRLSSLRFLFILRANFSERLLRLSLKNNPITQKPEYQEQVRRSLPRLTSLDGKPIRRPPLRFPKPWSNSEPIFSENNASRGVLASSKTKDGEPAIPRIKMAKKLCGIETEDGARGGAALSRAEYDLVVDTIERFLYIWETRRIPRTEMEKNAFVKDQCGRGGSGSATSRTGAVDCAPAYEEEEMDEDNFPYRYLHASATFSFTAAPELTLFDAARMRLDREVELDEGYDGMRLSAHDLRDVRVFDVSVKNSSRNLLSGSDAVLRFGRGPMKCFLAYQYSLYPERAAVNHHFPGAAISVHKIVNCSNNAGEEGRGAVRQPRAGAFGSSEISHYYLVTLHGTMTWRFPSMRQRQSIVAAFDRTFVLVRKVLPAQNTAWERRRSPKLVIYADEVLLRPLEETANTVPGSRLLPLYPSACASRLSRLVVQYGLETCQDGVAFVRAVMERTTSEGAEEAALSVLVFGVPSEERNPSPTGEDSETEEEPLPPHVKAANEAARAVLKHHEDEKIDASCGFSFYVSSLLDNAYELEGAKEESSMQSDKFKGHQLTLALVRDIAVVMNKHYTFHYS